LALSRRPLLRRALVRQLGRHPRLFAAVLDWATRAPARDRDPTEVPALQC
jgi:hypothetical protein